MAKHHRARGAEPFRADKASPEMRALLDQYVHAWENADIDALIALLKKDATFPMPPSPSWYRGRAMIRLFVAATILQGNARGRWRLLPTRANGSPAFGWFQVDESGTAYHAFAIQVLTLDGKFIADVSTFALPALFPKFGLLLKLKA